MFTLPVTQLEDFIQADDERPVSKDVDVHLWLTYREFHGLQKLKDVG